MHTPDNVNGLPGDPGELAGDAHRRCRFGRWYYDHTPAELCDQPVFTSMQAEHQRAHEIAARLLDQSARGVPIECGRAFHIEDARDRTVLFAGDLGSLVDTPLEHRGLYLVYLALPIDRLASEETYYSPDRRYWFGRVSEPQNYSAELRRSGETILTVEIPEGRWGRGVDFASGDRLEALVDQLAR